MTELDNISDKSPETVSETTVIPSVSSEQQEQQSNPSILSMEAYISKALSELQSQSQAQAQSQGLNQPYLLFPPTVAPPITQSTWSFTQGLIIGQVSVIFLMVIFIKFFIFSESAPKTPTKSSKKSKTHQLSVSSKNASQALSKNPTHRHNNQSDNNNTSIISSILEKTYYDVKTHTPESLDWFNVLIAQMISQFRNEALTNDNIYYSLTEAFQSSIIPDYLDKITISEINIGDDYPIFSNCRIKNNEGRLEAKIDVDVSDTFTLALETKLLINTPKPLSASLPIKLSVSIVRFSGCLTVSLISTTDAEEIDGTTKKSSEPSTNANTKPQSSPTSDDEDETTSKSPSVGLMFTFSPDFRLEFEVKSLIGSRTKLENIPRISSIIENVLRNWFIERCIEPRFQFIQLPSLWPRKRTTRQTAGTSTGATTATNCGINGSVLGSTGVTSDDENN